MSSSNLDFRIETRENSAATKNPLIATKAIIMINPNSSIFVWKT
jgi:DeoR/GlpR family transcriptional regulator of sugar metabolism